MPFFPHVYSMMVGYQLCIFQWLCTNNNLLARGASIYFLSLNILRVFNSNTLGLFRHRLKTHILTIWVERVVTLIQKQCLPLWNQVLVPENIYFQNTVYKQILIMFTILLALSTLNQASSICLCVCLSVCMSHFGHVLWHQWSHF